MNVLWLTPDKPENISVGRERIAAKLREEGHDIVVRGTTFETVRRSLCERGRYDAVIGVTRSGAFAGVAVATVHRVPLVVDHIDPIRQFVETNRRWLAHLVCAAENVAFRRANHVMYVYEEEGQRVRRYAKRVTKTALGVDYDRIADPPAEAKHEIRERLSEYDLRSNIAVYVGGLEPLYNIEPMLAGIQRLDDWSLVIAGAGSLAASVRAAADGEQIVFLGSVDHKFVPGVLHAADVGISLVDDPHTLKVLEYGAAELPVLQLAGRAEQRFGDRVTYCKATPASIADALRVASNRSVCDLASYVAQFDWGEIAGAYEQVLLEVAAASQS